jgi:hypothetical protein
MFPKRFKMVSMSSSIMVTIETLVLQRVPMFALVQQTFLAKNLVKSLLISTLDKVICYKGAFSQDSTKPLLQHKIGCRPAEKKLPFFQHASPSTKISMMVTFQLESFFSLCDVT